jgi:type II secretory pathway component PulM
MPLEGHFQRVNTPLRKLTPRERNVVIAGTLATVGVILALILATASDSRPAPAEGCVSAVVAGRVGGEPVNGCGEDAKEICARSANYDNPRARTINAKCDEAGIVVTQAEIAAAAKAKAEGLG